MNSVFGEGTLACSVLQSMMFHDKINLINVSVAVRSSKSVRSAEQDNGVQVPALPAL